MTRDPAPATRDTMARDHDLVERIRQGERKAIRDFYRRFHPLLMQWAERCGVEAGLRDEAATQCLNNALLVLRRYTTPMPRSLSAYLVIALRNAIRNSRRAENRDALRHRIAVREGAALGEWVISESCSEHSLRASEGPDREQPTVAPVLERLASALEEGLSADERRILGWVGDWVPQSVIAGWLGIPYPTLRSRVLRLRERLREVAARYASALDPDEQRVLKEFFRRTATSPRVRDVDRHNTTRSAVQHARGLEDKLKEADHVDQ